MAPRAVMCISGCERFSSGFSSLMPLEGRADDTRLHEDLHDHSPRPEMKAARHRYVAKPSIPARGAYKNHR